jgi:hypothetical protein
MTTPDQEALRQARFETLRTAAHLSTLLGDQHFRRHLEQLHADIGTLLRLLDSLDDDHARPSVYWHTDTEATP